MKINVIGTRGFPYVQGGVEKHCEILYHLIARKNHQINVFRRKPYVSKFSSHVPKNITFQDLWAPQSKYFETLIHSFFATLKSVFRQPDLIHIHNIGPSLTLPLFKIFNIPTVVTYHSDNYKHDKWNKLAKIILKIGEFFANNLADEVIVVSERQRSLLKNANVTYIPNGINLPKITYAKNYLNLLEVEPKKYILTVSRFSPEKGLELLIDAYEQINDANGYKLVIAGDADHDSEYSQAVKSRIAANPQIVGTGYITGDKLNQVFSHAGLFVLPSYHEGLPISLLEAMSYGLPVLVSDIPANREVGLDEKRYFQCGNVQDLQDKIEDLLSQELSEVERQSFRRLIAEKYNWEKIAEQTLAVYERAVDKKNR